MKKYHASIGLSYYEIKAKSLKEAKKIAKKMNIYKQKINYVM
jgi:hypothetical protein